MCGFISFLLLFKIFLQIKQDFARKLPDVITKITTGRDDFFNKIFRSYSKGLSERDNLYVELLSCPTLNQGKLNNFQKYLFLFIK